MSNVVAIAAGAYHSLALRSDGTVVAWGRNNRGQRSIPAGLSSVVALAAGAYHSVALRSDGTVAVWGANSYGQRTLPAGLSNVVAVAAGAYHSLALRSDGTVAAWGDNGDGQTTLPAGISLPATVSGSVDTNAPGSYVLTFSATNSLGVIGSATRTVVVRDTLPPVITLLGANPLTNLLDAPFLDPGATALDVCGGSLAIITNSTVDVTQSGFYTVSYRSTDASGNSATNTLTVVVVPIAPTVNTLLAGGMTATTATLNGTVHPGGGVTTVYFQYGLTTSYGSTSTTNTLDATNAVLNVTNLLSGLAPGTVYHYQMVVANSAGTTSGSDLSFTNLIAAPAVTTLLASDITATTATLNGTVHPGGGVTAVYFQYGLTTSYGSTSGTNLLAATNAVLNVTNLLSGLTPATIYHYRLVAANSAGTTLGSDQTFTNLIGAPVAGTDNLDRPNNTRVTKVLLATLLANDTDQEGDTLGITAVGSALPTGATVAISGAFAVYVAPSNTAGNGSFTYTLNDGFSSVTGMVTVTETTASSAAGSPKSESLTLVGRDFVLKFLGVPGRNYGVQYTTSLGSPYVWLEFVPAVSLLAPASGVLTHTDVNPLDPIRFYRVVLLP